MLKESEIIKEIVDILSREKINIQSQCEIGLFDDNKYWENIVGHLINSIYGLELKNLNDEKENYPGIDLGDKEEKIGVQVSTTKTSAKIVRSLDKVYDNEVYKEYPKFRMFILGDKQKSYSIDMEKYKEKIEFSADTDVYDFNSLIAQVNKMNREEMQEILDYLKMEFGVNNNDEVRKNIIYLVSYLEHSWEWIELARNRGVFLTDVYRCEQYIHRCEIVSSKLSPEENSKLYAMMTEIDQLIDYMEDGFKYLKDRTSKRRSSFLAYSDSYTASLGRSIRDKAQDILDKRDIYNVLKDKIKDM